MRSPTKLSAILVSVTLIGSATPGSLAQLGASTGPGKTITEVLAERGVRTDRDSLMAALTGPDQETQGYAAAELASQHATEAIPYITSAFEKATQSVPRFNLAQALVVLDRAAGLRRMTKLCQGSKEDPVIRLRASRSVRNSGSPDCDNAILEIPLSSEDPSAKLMALSLLAPGGAAVDASRVFQLETRLLNDENDAVRVAAAHALMQAADPGWRDAIRQRLVIEPSPDVRESLRKALEDTGRE